MGESLKHLCYVCDNALIHYVQIRPLTKVKHGPISIIIGKILLSWNMNSYFHANYNVACV